MMENVVLLKTWDKMELIATLIWEPQRLACHSESGQDDSEVPIRISS
jgi:hypothetical protein